MGAYTDFTTAREAILARVHEINDEINVNRNKYREALERYDVARLGDNPETAEKAKGECEALDQAYMWLQRDAQLLSEGGTRHAPEVKEAAKRVMEENREEMANLQAQWNDAAKRLEEHRAAFLSIVAGMGQIQQGAAKLRAQAEDVLATTGIDAPYLSGPGDRAVNLQKQTGLIYIDPKQVTLVYKNGKVK